jgi:hypothetical protein
MPQGQMDYQNVYSKHVLTKYLHWHFQTCFKETTVVPVPKNTKVTFLNDYQPVAPTFAAMKWFETLVMAHINTIIPETLDPHQFAYRPNRSTDDAISIALHTTISHLDKRNTYSALLKYSSPLVF